VAPFLEFWWDGSKQEFQLHNPFFAISEAGLDFLGHDMRSQAKSVRSAIGLCLEDLAQGGVHLIQGATWGRRQAIQH
jgi:hypothetical protein